MVEPKLGGYDWRAAYASFGDRALMLSVSGKVVRTGADRCRRRASPALWEVDVNNSPMRNALIPAALWS